MKTHTIKTPTAELMIVELPEGARHQITPTLLAIHHINGDIKIFKGSYTLLGKSDEIREEDAANLVHESKYMDFDGNSGYVDYKVYPDGLLSAKESLLSLLESEIYWDVNPYQKPENYNLWAKYGDFTQYGVGLTTESLKWREAEQKTFDRNRTLIFKLSWKRCENCELMQ